jgi:hypothetical protein
VAYVNFLSDNIGSSSKSKGSSTNLLPLNIPIYGPRFIPTPPLQFSFRSNAASIRPDHFHLKPITIMHPLYQLLPSSVVACPGCRDRSTKPNLKMKGWASDGPRLVHGLKEEEFALGYKLRCDTCQALNQQKSADKQAKEKDDDSSPASFHTTSPHYYQGVEHWQVPGMLQRHVFVNVDIDLFLIEYVPFFLHKSALTRELFDAVTELRVTVVSATLAEHIKRKCRSTECNSKLNQALQTCILSCS